MQTETSTRRKSSRISSKSSNVVAPKDKLPTFRYFKSNKTSKSTKGINHPNFVKPLSKNFVNVNQNNINIATDNCVASTDAYFKIDYIKLIKDLYPQVKDYLYIFEHELSSKHNEPKEFFLWMLNGLSELNQTDDLIAFDYNTNKNKFEAQLIKELHQFQNGGNCTDLFWLNNIPDSEDKRMLMKCIKMLVEDIHLDVYWYRYGNSEISLSDDIEHLYEFLEESNTDDENSIIYNNTINEYTTVALDLAKKIMSQKLNYYDILEYSESNGKYAEFAKHAWKLVKNNFRLYNYSSVAYINHNQWINSDDPYVELNQLYSLYYKIDEEDPIFWHLDQQFQSNANEYGVESVCNIIPISNPEQEKVNADLFESFTKIFDLLHNYGYKHNV